MAEYYMLHKPRGCITARRDPRCKTVMDYFPKEKRELLFPVGRLDKDTEGLLLVTDDGELCYSLLTPEKKIKKTYLFYALGVLSEDEAAGLEAGVTPFTDKSVITAPATVNIDSVTVLREIKHLLGGKDVALANKKGELPVTVGKITITEGKKHQVKRMILSAGCRVLYLKRLSMAGLSLDSSLRVGEYRELTDEEIALIKNKTAGV